jgi:teichuronic acid exporter
MRRTQTVGWAYGLTWGRQGIQAATMLIVAANIGPSEFGIMALALIYIGVIEAVLQQGFAGAIIQRQVLNQSHVSSVFWLITTFSVALALAGALLARYWANATGTPALESVIPALSLTIPLVGLGVVPTALLTRHLRLKELTIRSIGAAVVSCAVAIPLAINGFGVWALVAQHVAYAFTSTVLVWSASRWWPAPRFELAAARELLPFSFANFGAKTGTIAAFQMDAIVIGFFWGATAVGLYRLAARCVGLAIEFLSGPLQFVSFPELSKLQQDPDRFREGFLSYVRFASLITWPSLAILAVAGPYIPRVLGAQWAGIEYVLAVLAFCGAIETLTQFVGPLLQSLGRPGSLAALMWIQGAVGAILFAATGALFADADLAFQSASIGLARGLLFMAVSLPALLVFSSRLIGLRLQTALRAIFPAALCALSVYFMGIALREGLGVSGLNIIAQAILLVLPLGLAWIAGVMALSAGARQLVSVAARKYSPLFLSRS